MDGSGRRRVRGKAPARLVMQDDRFDATDSVTVCAFTTDATEAPLIRLPATPDEENGLHERSSLMVDKITTMPRAKVRARIGRYVCDFQDTESGRCRR